jgi:broad specificity phosphatase PhoE
MVKQLILIRHAHRETFDRSVNNGLSEKGLRQAKWLKRFAEFRFTSQDWKELEGRVLSSPKLRCIETVTPLAAHFGSPVERSMELDEQRPGESFAQFNERMQKFMHWWTKDGPPLLLACSHGDWLPLGVFHLIGTSIDMKKGSWLEIEWQQGQGAMRWYVPSFKVFYAERG